ncbi:MAG: FAD-binding oxidoreductase [Candidatus Dormibacteria bacterium]
MSERLAGAVGPSHVREGQAAEAWLRDGTFVRPGSALVVRPADTTQVAAVLRACAEADTPVTPRGAGTSLSGGPVATQGGVVLCLDRLDRLEIDRANGCAVAGAGVITARLQAAALDQGLMYPPDPASVAICTIGGNVACNAGGMSCLKYGVTADYVVGMTVVLANGEVLTLGGRTRKRASGYRLMQLFTGSEGTLGIVTEVIVKLIPHPPHRATALVAYGSAVAAAEGVTRLMGSGHLPVALELMDRSVLLRMERELPRGFGRSMECALIVEQDGTDLDAVQGEMRIMVDVLNADASMIAANQEERDQVWQARRAVGQMLLADPAHALSEDVSVPLSAIPEMISRIHAAAGAAGLQALVIGHAGDGNLHPMFFFTDEERERVELVAGQVMRDAVALGGSVSAEHGLGAVKRDFAVREHGEPAVRLMAGLKTLLDPTGMLNPGKVLPSGGPEDSFLSRIPGWLP